MRIISGKYKGRSISVPGDVKFRPTTGKVKEALFSSLEALLSIDGLVVADLYAGSGAFGLEALSRGAAFALFVEANAKLSEAIKKNAQHLGVNPQEAVVFKCSVEQGLVVLKQKLPDTVFDVIFCDPPYDGHPGDRLMNKLLSNEFVRSGSIIIIESSANLSIAKEFKNDQAEARLIKEKNYGQTTLRFYEAILPQ